MTRDKMIIDIRKIYPWYSLKNKTDRQIACIHTRIISESREQRINNYHSFLKRTDDEDMYHEVWALLIELL